MRPKRFLALPGLVLLLAALAAGGCRSGRDADGEPVAAFSRVRPPVAFEMLRDTPSLPVIDLRSRFEFTGPAGHLRHARNVPLPELRERLVELAPLKDRTFLIYCGHGDCGARAQAFLVEAGFDEVVLMDGGLDAWVMDGFGTVTGPPPPMEFPRDPEEIAVE